jgi:hypothetical protein
MHRQAPGAFIRTAITIFISGEKSMHTFGTVALLLGMFLLIAAQLYVTAMTFKINPRRGMLCFVIPGYALLVAKRNGFYGKFLAAFGLGFLGLVTGGGILS